MRGDPASGEIIGETSARAADIIVLTAFARFLGRFIKDVTEELGVHPPHRDIVDLRKFLNISHFEIVEGKTIETIAVGGYVHGAVIGAAQV